jgi:hypothetical protein
MPTYDNVASKLWLSIKSLLKGLKRVIIPANTKIKASTLKTKTPRKTAVRSVKSAKTKRSPAKTTRARSTRSKAKKKSLLVRLGLKTEYEYKKLHVGVALIFIAGLVAGLVIGVNHFTSAAAAPYLDAANHSRCDVNTATNPVTTKQKFVATVKMTNDGTNGWYPTYGAKLVELTGGAITNKWSATGTTPAGVIAPGQTATFLLSVTAPDSPGTYEFDWAMAVGTLGIMHNPCTGGSIVVKAPTTTGVSATPTTPTTDLRCIRPDYTRYVCPIAEYNQQVATLNALAGNANNSATKAQQDAYFTAAKAATTCMDLSTPAPLDTKTCTAAEHDKQVADFKALVAATTCITPTSTDPLHTSSCTAAEHDKQAADFYAAAHPRVAPAGASSALHKPVCYWTTPCTAEAEAAENAFTATVNDPGMVIDTPQQDNTNPLGSCVLYFHYHYDTIDQGAVPDFHTQWNRVDQDMCYSLGQWAYDSRFVPADYSEHRDIYPHHTDWFPTNPDGTTAPDVVRTMNVWQS